MVRCQIVLVPNCPVPNCPGAKLSWCQIVRVPNSPFFNSWCQIVRCQIVLQSMYVCPSLCVCMYEGKCVHKCVFVLLAASLCVVFPVEECRIMLCLCVSVCVRICVFFCYCVCACVYVYVCVNMYVCSSLCVAFPAEECGIISMVPLLPTASYCSFLPAT